MHWFWRRAYPAEDDRRSVQCDYTNNLTNIVLTCSYLWRTPPWDHLQLLDSWFLIIYSWFLIGWFSIRTPFWTKWWKMGYSCTCGLWTFQDWTISTISYVSLLFRWEEKRQVYKQLTLRCRINQATFDTQILPDILYILPDNWYLDIAFSVYIYFFYCFLGRYMIF